MQLSHDKTTRIQQNRYAATNVFALEP